MIIATGLPLITAGVAMIMDIQKTKVDNGWLIFMTAIGVLARILWLGLGTVLSCMMGAVLPLLLLFWLYHFRMLGPGDIKLFCALGAMLGMYGSLSCMAGAILCGAAISIAILGIYGEFQERFQYFTQYMRDLITTGEWKPYYRKGMALENFHFTVAIFLSVVLYTGGVL